MRTVFYEPSDGEAGEVQFIQVLDVEERFVSVLRSRVVTAIEKNGLQWAASTLGIATTGVETLLWNRAWDIEKAVTVAIDLGILTHDDLDCLEH